ncbi:hypothetical protein GGQ64_001900 [Rhizobium azooxidifex]|uniref:Uncharacterized protein n=1 Tax=Mycoplana azooxidifex TaxID=1636188 RepID=A0A7W6GIP4_9HYPH|nr:hypothetical protein [Mycoplana azooxidifex]
MSRMSAWRAYRKAVRLWLEKRRQRAAERRALAILRVRGDKRLLDEADLGAEASIRCGNCRGDGPAVHPGIGGDSPRWLG